MRLGYLGAALLVLTLSGCTATRREQPPPAPPVAPAPEAPPSEDEGSSLLTPPGLRLDARIRPLRQTVTLELDPRQEAFRGTAEIELTLTEATRQLWLHGEELTVKDATFLVDGTRIQAMALPLSGLIAFVPPKPLGPGTVTLRVEYTGLARAQENSGVFREQEAGRWYAMTQFQALYARRAFPCFDEPSFKIPWQLTLRVRAEDGAFSNAPVDAEERGADGWKTVRFQPTPPLPSYLVAFAVGPFEVVDAGTAGRNRVPVRMLVPHGRAAEAAWAARVTPPLLEELEAWFGTPYPFAKLDVLAMAGSQGGAMEHPGLITFGAQLMLGPVEGDSSWRQRFFAQTQAHELAHQWFGNLVTLGWWDDLWLNESFADWLSYKVVTKWRPAWRWDVRRVEARGQALKEDRLVSARAIRQPIESPGDIDAAFDGITYNKGAAVLAMFEAWVGPDAFQQGVRRYLDAHARGTATTAAFFQALSAAAGRDVAPAFSTFLDRPGVPRVAMELQCPADAPPRLALEQRRYLPLGSPGSAADARPWHVPVCVRYVARGKEGRACTMLTGSTGTLVLEGAKGCPDQVHPNAEARGYYHALPRGDGLARLERQGGKGLEVSERLVLMDDAQALVASGDLDVAQALSLTTRLLRPDDPDLVAGAADVVGGVRDDFVPDTLRPQRARFVRGLFGGLARRLGFVARPGEREEQGMLRPLVVWMVANVGEDSALRAEARKLALRWLEDRGSLSSDEAWAVLNTAAAGGDATLHQRLREALRTTTESRERQLLFSALGAFQDTALARSSLELLLAPEVDAREALPVLFGQLSTVPTRSVAFDFVREHFEPLRKRLPRDTATWLLATGGSFCDAAHRQQALDFFSPYTRQIEGGERVLAQSLERVDLCIAQRAALRPGLERFLGRY
ncbi:M1 family metallopeptidase [Pyxidicoccus xibeiensis]|uniref:M1 family metallopeptidase n=1 Tax=Pyxidicoccus xibeiensis TaxID=2906759 RepID=UPI0020A77B0E|nr:M1 family aminopeptidase [Pyxidicoccus xibeiensis]MCP3144383.1 ERAP1-like C-terminal domain-containing protein [Pyxidicoccus xibeiensis]